MENYRGVVLAPGLMLMLHTAEPTGTPMVIMSHDLNGVAPTEIQLVPYGVRKTPKYGTLIIDDESIASIMAIHAERMNDQVIDYEHQSWETPPVVAPAAGWIKQIINKGKDGVWGIVEWTAKARSMIEAKEYRYFSPVTMTRKKDGKVLGLIGGGLTNLPNIDGMVPLINKSTLTQPAPLDGKGKGEGDKPKKEERTMFKELLKLLGLPESATEAEAIAAHNTLLANKATTVVVANKAVLEALGLKEGTGESEVVATVMANRQAAGAIEQLTVQVNKLTAELERKGTEDVVTLVNKAIEGDSKGAKLTPAQKDWALAYAKRDLEGFKLFLNKAPYIVLKDNIAGEEHRDETPALDAAQVQINKLMGTDAETFKKFAPKVAAVVLFLFLFSGLFSGFFAAPTFAALSAERDTASRAGQTFELGVAATKKIYKGALVAVDASGYATPGATATTIVGLGRAEETKDNTAGLDGALNVRIARGIFRFANSADADLIANDDIGQLCYIVDDATVALTNGSDTRSPAGRIFGVDSSGVWVEFLHFSAPGTVVSADIVDGTIVTADIADDQVTSAKLAHDLTLGAAVTSDLTITAAILGGTPFVLDGTTDNTNELSITLGADPGSDLTLTLPATVSAAAMISSLTTNDVDVANSVWGKSNALCLGGATGGDGFETCLQPTDPGADFTITVPAATGTMAFTAGAGSNKTVTAGSGTTTVTAADCGKVFTAAADADGVFNLPATVSGCVLTFVNIGAAANNLLTINPDNADQIFGTVTLAASVVAIAGSAGDAVSNTKGTSIRGDAMTLVGDGADGWYIVSSTGIWADIN